MSGHTYTHTHDNYYNPRCAHAQRGLINYLKVFNCCNVPTLHLVTMVTPGEPYYD